MSPSHCTLICAAALVMAAFCVGVSGQQTTAFSYQGRLTDTSAAANGSYDMQFSLYDSLTGGTQQPQPNPVTITRTGVQVANGIFTVSLDFGASAFAGADRYLDISVKKSRDPTYTLLTPRQQILSSPYAVQTINASQLGGIAANQYVQTNDARLADARPASSVNFGTATLAGVLPTANGGTGTSDGSGLTTGQTASTVFGTAALNATPSFSDIPGLTQTITVPANSKVCMTTDGGVQGLAGNVSVDVAIFVDGSVDSVVRRVSINSTSGTDVGEWSITQCLSMTSSHTLIVRAAVSSGVGVAVVSGNPSSAIQGELTVLILKQ